MKIKLSKKTKTIISNTVTVLGLISVVPLMIFMISITLNYLKDWEVLEPVPGVQCFVFTRAFSLAVSCLEKGGPNEE